MHWTIHFFTVVFSEADLILVTALTLVADISAHHPQALISAKVCPCQSPAPRMADTPVTPQGILVVVLDTPVTQWGILVVVLDTLVVVSDTLAVLWGIPVVVLDTLAVLRGTPADTLAITTDNILDHTPLLVSNTLSGASVDIQVAAL